jgi:flagellar basal-body rod protein FlgC
MDVYKTMDVIGSALSAERTRLNVISSNVANANTASYRRKDAVLESVPQKSEFGEVLDQENDITLTEVRVSEIREDQSPLRQVYKPEDPDANAEGYVSMPNVNPITEMANMISADRAYQTNVNLFQTTKSMALKALEIGK